MSAKQTPTQAKLLAAQRKVDKLLAESPELRPYRDRLLRLATLALNPHQLNPHQAKAARRLGLRAKKKTNAQSVGSETS